MDMDEPTGLMSHHLRQDAAAWQFMATFFTRLSGHPGAHWPKPTTLFGRQPDDAVGDMTVRQTNRWRYPRRAIALEYFYTVLGLTFTLLPLALVTPLQAVTGVLSGLAFLFFTFGIRTALRHNVFVEVSDSGITLGRMLNSSWGETIPWNEISELKLSYFSTRRDRHGGWMQLRLRGNKRTIRLDSTLDGFDKLLSYAAHQVRRQGLELSSETLQNLNALGVLDASQAVAFTSGDV